MRLKKKILKFSKTISLLKATPQSTLNMSFYSYKDFIEEGDLVLAFISRGATKPINVTKGQVLNTRYGHFEHDKMIQNRWLKKIFLLQ